MLPLTGSDHECISSLTMTTLPSCPFYWGDIASLISTSLASSELSSSTNVLVCSSMCPTPRLRRTPASQAVRTVHHHATLSQTDPHPILVHRHQFPSDDQRSSSYRATNSPLTTNDHKQPVYHSRIPSLPSTSSGPDPTQALCWPYYVSTSSSPATLVNGRTLQTLIKPSASSHHLHGLS